VYVENDVERWMWSANIGNSRTCLACIAMHGTIHPSTEVLNDHWKGRCAMMPITPKWSDLGIVGANEDAPFTGVAWFEAQPDSVQIQAMGGELYDFWRAGLFKFDARTVVTTDSHPVFGEMRHRKSNYAIIGAGSAEDAKRMIKQMRRDVVF
jgi:hypothetical protein